MVRRVCERSSSEGAAVLCKLIVRCSRALVRTYGGYCAAVQPSVYNPNIVQASPDGQLVRDRFAPGGSQQFTFYDGPVPQSINGVRVLATDQSGPDSWELLG
jgi:hypothetical protein